MNTPSDPLSEAKQLRQERADLNARIKQADRAAVAHGLATGMKVAEIAVAIGANPSHVYAVRHALREEGADQ